MTKGNALVQFNGVLKLEGLGTGLGNSLARAGEHNRTKASRAGKIHKAFIDAGCDRLMTFSEFKVQGKRNKIRKDLGLEPLYLSGEGQPGAARMARSRQHRRR